MKRQLPLVLVVACLCAACTTSRRAESDVLVSGILRERSENLVCPVGEVRLCRVDEDDEKHCECIDHGEIFGRR